MDIDISIKNRNSRAKKAYQTQLNLPIVFYRDILDAWAALNECYIERKKLLLMVL